jgi:RNA polymerase sigma-70 factor (ECF subfamily)
MRFQLAFRLASCNATFLDVLHHSAGIISSGMNAAPENLPELLAASSSGDASARDQLVSLVYNELRRLAQNYLRRERLDHTLQATALVHEAYLRLIGQTQVPWRNREHFLGVAAQMMRRVLVDHSRGRGRAKRGADRRKISMSGLERLPAADQVDFSALDDALKALETLDVQKGRVVELRYFGGLSIQETARVLNISTATVERDWRFARAFLQNELATNPG